VLLLGGILSAVVAATTERAALDALSQGQLEQRLKVIDSKLDNLASFSLRGGVGSIGFRSITYPTPAQAQWVQINLSRPCEIDQIVLVPTIWRDTKTGFRQDGFPEAFRIMVGTHEGPGTEIASFTAKDRLLPRIAPVVIPCHGVKAAWVRVEVTLLSPRAWDQLYDFELAEILVFSGQENVALRQPTQASSDFEEEGSNRSKDRLVDGFMPYLMDAANGNKSIAFLVALNPADRPSLTFDLGSVRSINRIHLHATDTSDNVPQSTPSDYGIPRKLMIEGSNREDFSDAVPLLDFDATSLLETGPIIMLNFPDTPCRYVRLVTVDPYLSDDRQYFAFAEIEIFSGGQNVLISASPVTNFVHIEPDRHLRSLTDSANLYGTILPIRSWLEELALRHDLETERPLVLGELNQRYARQKIRLVWMGWLATILAAGIVVVILIERIRRLRQAARIRERFAADLHDELGADIHSIRLLCELALSAKGIPERLEKLLQSSHEISQRASLSVRHCMNMQDDSGLYSSLKEDMHRAADRIMAQLEYDISVEGEEFLHQLKTRTKTDLFLFFKECLINISRHADATRFNTRLTATRNEIHMAISDNGRGLSNASGKKTPPSLQRRARLLGARVVTGTSESGGTLVTLNLSTRRLGIRK
jgi:signal transduction histidine kinase